MGLLQINNLHVNFPTKAGVVRASDGVSLEIKQGESLALVGESGCGKTIVALSIMRLLPEDARISGEIRFEGKNLLSLGKEEIREIRGREIAMIFEQPATCLNPVFTVGDQISEAVRVHNNCSRKESKERAIELMEMVGIPSPQKRCGQYPHEFSGGMQQRVMIAIALALSPSLLIADEPTTSLDVTIQAQIMELLKDLIAKFKTSLFLITHNLGVAAEMCDNVAVMYAGEIVERGRLSEVFEYPRHPYTKALLGAISNDGLRPIKGSVPELTRLPNGCRFHPRCPQAENVCRKVRPEMRFKVRCHLWD
ncbi:MAG: ABC transporter ATP-binding protein [Dehalococcoidia bacterium]|nr:Oligopeptide transport ATP-binding protein OppD [Chloroflexota bacterium]MBT9159843.1 Oligopeptide transport ATP-binding protein OppD [Chloroflexota bacterium]MBT9161862.1 Oligopeptide transport ATP-binding protein OppD [Chloroflexota bacterium]